MRDKSVVFYYPANLRQGFSYLNTTKFEIVGISPSILQFSKLLLHVRVIVLFKQPIYFKTQKHIEKQTHI